MKPVAWILLAAVLLVVAVSCGHKKTDAPKMLVLYYSQTATTRALAEEIATRTGAVLEAIVPVEPYDCSFEETVARGQKEVQEGKLPALQPLNANLSDYDIIFLCYPVWFGTVANPVAAFLKTADLRGKQVVPFCTFGSGGLVSSAKDIAAALPQSEVRSGYGVRAARIDAMPGEVERFLKENGYLAGTVEPLPDFPEAHPASEAEAAIFDAAVRDYPRIQARATEVASRTVPSGVEYLFTAVELPREGAPQREPQSLKVYVIAAEGQAPVFTQVVR